MRLISTLITLLIVIGFSGCKTNRTVNHDRVGKWVFKDTVNGILYKSRGRYKKSREIKTWKYFENGKLVKTEKYIDNICHIKVYDAKGKISSMGKSIIIEKDNEIHWFLNGDWIFFDPKGRIIGIKKYENGEMVSEIDMS